MVSAAGPRLEAILDALAGWDEVEAFLVRSSAGDRPPTRRERWQRQLDHEQLLLRAMRHPRADTRCHAAMVGRDLASVVAMALHDSCAQVRAAGASSRVAPLHLLADVVNDPHRSPRYELARNERAPLSVLVRLIDDPDRDVRCLAAGHPAFSPSLLSELVFYPDSRMVHAVIDNPSATPEVLDLVASRRGDHPRVTARLAVAVTERRAARVGSV